MNYVIHNDKLLSAAREGRYDDLSHLIDQGNYDIYYQDYVSDTL